MIRFIIGLHDRISGVINDETTMRGYDKETGKLVETIRIKPRIKFDKEDKNEADG